MIVRIVSALVGIIILIGVLVVPNPIVLVCACALLAAIATYELLNGTGLMKQKSLLITSMVFAASEIVVYYYADVLGALIPATSEVLVFVQDSLPLLLLLLYVLTLIVHMLIPALHVSLESGEYAFLLTLYATVGFGSIAMLRQIRNIGWWLVLLLLIIAWTSDTGAYFVGTFLGKHKMAPKISPKKSWEGFFGGWIISVLCAYLLFVIRFKVENSIGDGMFYSMYYYLPIVCVLAPLSVCGDLLASVIKRKCGIKDFGNIMPGHGGVMDRFDSVVFIAPMLYVLASYYTEIVSFCAKLFS